MRRTTLLRSLVSRAGAALARETISLTNALKDRRVQRLILALYVSSFFLSLTIACSHRARRTGAR